jgi:hypothetical protein
MSLTINGIYRAGHIELTEDPKIAGEAPVVVTFLDVPRTPASEKTNRMMTSGMLAVPGRRMSNEEDFRDAEYHDSEWDREDVILLTHDQTISASGLIQVRW